MVALLTGEALQVVHVISGPHDHLEGWNHFGTCSTVAGVAEQPEVVPPAEDEVCFGIERGTNFTKSAVATATFQTVLVPEQVQGLQ